MSNLFGPPDTPENFFADMAGPTGRLEALPGGDAGVKKTLKKMKEFTREGSKDPNIRQLAMSIIRKCRVKDALCETKAVFKWVQENLRWTRDVDGVETLQKPARTLSPDWRAGDCLPRGTLLLTSDYQFVPIEQLQLGMTIVGGDGFTEVEGIVHKGTKEVIRIKLSNGCEQVITKDHRVFLDRNGEYVEVKAGDVKVGDVIRSIKSLPFGLVEDEADLVYVEGLCIADGWCEDYRFAISGKDGKPKEAQKLEVQSIMNSRGVNTRWHPRYIAVNDPQLARRMAECGSGAINKRCPRLNYNQECVEALYRGLLADSGIATNGTTTVFSTISKTLALQYRVILKMLGVQCSMKKVDDHGGLGKNPIYRVTERRGGKIHGPRVKVKVKSIEPAGEADVYDIETSSGTIYLPESDWVVHNCDDLSMALAALLLSVGIGPVRFKVIAADPENPEGFSHVYLQVAMPTSHNQMAGLGDTGEVEWVSLDPSPPGVGFGWEHDKRFREGIFNV